MQIHGHLQRSFIKETLKDCLCHASVGDVECKFSFVRDATLQCGQTEQKSDLALVQILHSGIRHMVLMALVVHDGLCNIVCVSFEFYVLCKNILNNHKTFGPYQALLALQCCQLGGL